MEQLKGLPQTFMIVGSLDLFCDEDMDYAQKLIEAGVLQSSMLSPAFPTPMRIWREVLRQPGFLS